MEGLSLLMARLLYGTGMRLMECVRLRVRDVELTRQEITIRGEKGRKDRMTLFPESLAPALHNHIDRALCVWDEDRFYEDFTNAQ